MRHPLKKKPTQAIVCLFVLLSFFPSPSVAADSRFEVQFGSFAIKSAAAALVRDLNAFSDTLYISKITTQANDSFFTVRAGVFDTVDKAAAFKNSFNQFKPGITPLVMVQDSMEEVQVEIVTPDLEQPGEETADQDSQDTLWADEKPESGAKDTLWGGDNPDAGETGAVDTLALQPKTGASPENVSALEKEIETLKTQVKTLMDAEDIRSELTESKEEKSQKEDDILNAAGRNYTLMQKGKLGVEYKIAYTYYAYDAIKELNIIEHNSNHNITNTFTLEYPLKDNLTLEAALPFVYEYDEVGSDDSKSVTDFGDVSFGASFQPLKSGGKMPSMIINTTLTCPMGRNPYEVNPLTELSTGSGGYSLAGSISMSKPIDPIMAYGTLSYTYKHPIKDLDYKIGSYTLEQYDRGDSLGFSLGLGYALSYKTSLSVGYSYSHTFESTRYYKEANPVTYPTQTSSSISIGTSWRLSPKLRLNMSLGIGLGNSDYFSLSFRFPFEFNL